MATYLFETITANEAAVFATPSTISVAKGTAAETTVLFEADDRITVIIEGRQVTFGPGLHTTTAPADPPMIEYPDGSLLIVGGPGTDIISASATPAPRNGAIYAGGSDDTVRASGAWLVQGNQGNDTIYLLGGPQTVYGGQGDDTITVNGGGLSFVQGNKGSDEIGGSRGRDTLLGGQGDDEIIGVEGQDFLNGNLGADTITGGGLILGEGDADLITTYAKEAATVRGGDGNDRITLGGASAPNSPGLADAQPSQAFGDGGDDILQGGTGADTLMGGDGADTLSSGADTTSRGATTAGDLLDGGPGDDVLTTRAGDNILRGGDGNDRLTAAGGADTLDGGIGVDIMIGDNGGPMFGADVFVLDDPYANLTGTSGLDRITDWSSADRLQFRTPGGGYTETTATDFNAAVAAVQALFGGGTVEVVAVQLGDDVVVFGDGSAANTVFTGAVLVGRTLADISVTNIL